MADIASVGDTFLLVSGCTDNLELLTDDVHLRAVLCQIPGLIGMSPLREPLVSVATNNPGLEGYVPIDLSNITISTYTGNPRVVLCVHSCQELDAEAVLRFMRESYQCKTIRSLSLGEEDFR